LDKAAKCGIAFDILAESGASVRGISVVLMRRSSLDFMAKQSGNGLAARRQVHGEE